MKLWVTGGAGFLGSHMADALVARGDDVTIVDNFLTGFTANLRGPAGRATLVRGAVQDAYVARRLGAERPKAILHFAGDALVRRSVEEPRADFERNVMATLDLLEAVRRESPETKVLFASSGAVYGDRAEEPFRETDATWPISPYAAGKLAAERYCFAYAHTYGLRTCSLRLFSVYGPRQRKQVVYDLIRKIHENPHEVSLFGDGSEERDFSYAGNIVDAFLLAAEVAEFRGEVFNVAGDEIVSIRGLAELMCELMGARPAFAFSGALRPGDSRRWVADTSRLRALGYRPRVGLREGLCETIEWYLRSGSE